MMLVSPDALFSALDGRKKNGITLVRPASKDEKNVLCVEPHQVTQFAVCIERRYYSQARNILRGWTVLENGVPKKFTPDDEDLIIQTARDLLNDPKDAS